MTPSSSISRRIRGFILFLAIFISLGTALAQKHLPAKPVDLNAATIKELEELPGVGPVTAQRIIDTRQKSGRFRRVEDLLAVRGISQKKLDAVRPFVTVTSSVPPAPAKKSGPPTKGAISR